MTKHVTAVPESLSVGNAWRIMREKNIRHLPVVDRGKLVGIVSDRDLLLHGTTSPTGEITFTNRCLADIMTLEPRSCSPESSVSQAARTMTDHKIDALPVVADGHLVGLVTSTDLLLLLVDASEKRLPFSFEISFAGSMADAVS